MQTANKPENTNNSHEAHPSLGKAHKSHYRVLARMKDCTGAEGVKPIAVEAFDREDAINKAQQIADSFGLTYIRTVDVNRR